MPTTPISPNSAHQDAATPPPPAAPDEATMIKQLQRVVCICKGIPLAKVLPSLKQHHQVEKIHEVVGTGSGGCKGRRCTPRIHTLLEKSTSCRTPQATTPAKAKPKS